MTIVSPCTYYNGFGYLVSEITAEKIRCGACNGYRFVIEENLITYTKPNFMKKKVAIYVLAAMLSVGSMYAGIFLSRHFCFSEGEQIANEFAVVLFIFLVWIGAVVSIHNYRS